MTDRELLELAAKAAGIAGYWVSNFGSGDYYYQGNADGIYHEYLGGGYTVWNPLTCDGDALRLAVKLRIDVHYAKDYVTAVYAFDRTAKEDFGGDPDAATRRAIVRAAAEIEVAIDGGWLKREPV